MSGVRIPPPRPTPSGNATEKGVNLRVSAADALLALLDGGCSSPGRAPDCGSGGSGFETRQPPHSKFCIFNEHEMGCRRVLATLAHHLSASHRGINVSRGGAGWLLEYQFTSVFSSLWSPSRARMPTAYESPQVKLSAGRGLATRIDLVRFFVQLSVTALPCGTSKERLFVVLVAAYKTCMARSCALA